MDPNATLQSLIEAASAPAPRWVSRDDRAEAIREHAEALADWIERGGFLPTTDSTPTPWSA